ncbi:hypothetical protein RRG08_054866 [Elysia crispata]|uniref:Uncharacterized protein n=1 Tax=Elysia crispata TaxID=231223 RepID=A0AAE1A7A3_9GAST|nr:hypothetical protein RRG08_054866 [Elysia crispata]
MTKVWLYIDQTIVAQTLSLQFLKQHSEQSTALSAMSALMTVPTLMILIGPEMLCAKNLGKRDFFHARSLTDSLGLNCTSYETYKTLSDILRLVSVFS